MHKKPWCWCALCLAKGRSTHTDLLFWILDVFPIWQEDSHSFCWLLWYLYFLSPARPLLLRSHLYVFKREDVYDIIVPRLPSIRILSYYRLLEGVVTPAQNCSFLGRAELSRLSYLLWVFRKISFPFDLYYSTIFVIFLTGNGKLKSWDKGIDL